MGTLPWKLELVPGWFSRIYFFSAVVEQVFGSFMAAIADRMASSIRVPPSRGFSPDFFSYFPRRKRKASRQNSPKPGQDKLLCTRWVGAPALAQIGVILKHCTGNAARPALTGRTVAVNCIQSTGLEGFLGVTHCPSPQIQHKNMTT